MRRVLILAFATATFSAAFAQDPNPTTLEPKHCQVGNEVIVPNILGFKPDAAKKIAEDCGLVWSFSANPQTISYEAIGTIGDQEPSGGKLVKKGDILRGFTSKGVFVPDFTGWQVKEVELFVKDLRHGFTATSKRDKAPVGQVIEQQPLNAVFYYSGLPVTVVVSEGPWVKLPKLVGERHVEPNSRRRRLERRLQATNDLRAYRLVSGRRNNRSCRSSFRGQVDQDHDKETDGR